MNQTFTIFTNEHYQNVNDSTSNSEDRFRTFTKTKNKQEKDEAIVIINQHPKRYFDSPSMITFDNDDEDDDEEAKEIPIVRCANKSSMLSGPEPSLDESDLTDLYTFVNRK